MNIGLFASDTVGHEVARFLGQEKEPLACLVLDVQDHKGLNARIVADSGVTDAARVFYSDCLYQQATLDTLRGLNLDLVVLAWWPYILKESIIRIPRLGCLNFHPSYLPYNRGRNYNFWTLVEDTPFGVTLHFVDKGVDTGDIAFQSRIDKTWEDTGETLYRKAQSEMLRLFKDSWPLIKRGAIPRTPQDRSRGNFHKAAELEPASRIDLEAQYQARDLLNLIRARTFPPHPGAWFMENGEKYEVRIQITKVNDVTVKASSDT